MLLRATILQGTKAEWFNRLVRNRMEGAAVPVENSKGEWGFGQQKINLRFAESLEMADRQVVYENGVKEIAALNQVAVTFMAKLGPTRAAELRQRRDRLGAAEKLRAYLRRDRPPGAAGPFPPVEAEGVHIAAHVFEGDDRFLAVVAGRCDEFHVGTRMTDQL